MAGPYGCARAENWHLVLALPGLSVLLFWENVTLKLTQRARNDFFSESQ